MSNDLSPDERIDLVVSNLNEKDLPVLIQGRLGMLKELDNSVSSAIKAAEDATEAAKNAKNKSAGFGKKKAAIEELQSAGLDLAKAVQLDAEAQKKSFEFQTKLAEITKYLFGLGVSNIANNRIVVRELEKRLKGASQEELSELAKQELTTVVKQLKDQEDILKKQEILFDTIKIHDDKLKDQVQKNQQIDEQLIVQTKIDKLHDEQLQKQFEDVKKFDEQLGVLQNKNHNLTEQMKDILKTIEAQEIKINILNSETLNLKNSLNTKASNTISIITLTIAVLSLVAILIYSIV